MEELFLGRGFNFINFFLLLLFGSTFKNWYSLISEALSMVGMWKILEKSEICGW